MDSQGSITFWIDRLHRRDPEAPAQLLQRFFDRLKRLAHRRLDDTVIIDAEDVALSAFFQFCQKVQQGNFSGVRDRDDLWRLLAKIACNKASDVNRYNRRRPRSERPVTDDQDVSPLLEPDLVAICEDECRRLLNILDDDLRNVAELRLIGYTNREIAQECNRSLSTIERSLRSIRSRWQAEMLPHRPASGP